MPAPRRLRQWAWSRFGWCVRCWSAAGEGPCNNCDFDRWVATMKLRTAEVMARGEVR